MPIRENLFLHEPGTEDFDFVIWFHEYLDRLPKDFKSDSTSFWQRCLDAYKMVCFLFWEELGVEGSFCVLQKGGRYVGYSLQPIGASFFLETWRRFCLRQGIDYKGTWVHLRHFVFERQKVSNVPEVMLARMAGHKTRQIANTYGHANFQSSLSVQRRIRASYVVRV